MRRRGTQGNTLSKATVAALGRIIDPLMEIALSCGLTVQQVNLLLRDRAVRVAANNILRDSSRVSKSRVAILTGLGRSEVSKILALKETPALALGIHPASRVLAAWFEDPRFLSHGGQPEILPIYGRRKSFELLVKVHGSGLPVRAMLDALLEVDAVKALPNQRLRPKSRIPVLTGLSPRSVEALGARCEDLLRTLLANLYGSSPPLFEATASSTINVALGPLVRRELEEQALSFINASNSILSRARTSSESQTKSVNGARVGIAVHYFEQTPIKVPRKEPGSGNNIRKNLRRR